ncbi:MAG: Arginyl-tRNA synthetase [uncultured Acidimicrobiales bacterium]|uniref:Arginine--tRNA ligase n=1 Tax=uncultured Acidimicrobiales bacterium TaxID=310071 RepID=A0A6J4IVW0_9ACTN|nr:MAG: Arginyl-tRNA synthetase [uncultured Acidimicrobiales bacterium]
MPPALLPLLGSRVAAAVSAAFGPDVAAPSPLVLPTKDPRHGDCTVAAPLALARTLRKAPLELAGRLAAALEVDDLCEAPEVVPPGFVNLRLRAEWLAEQVAVIAADDRAGVAPADVAQHVMVDYSGPNVAKEMHVGHLRSTVIGDCLADVFELLGHRVDRLNHLGDWGTQFGMLITHLADTAPEAMEPGAQADVGDLVAFYREAKARFDEDEAFAQRARARVVDLQSGEATARRAWSALVDRSKVENQVVYDLLGVSGLEDRGESFYQPMLAAVVADLDAAGLLVVDDGARCVFVEGFTNRDGERLPLIVQKADGGYNYNTSDLAAVRHRVGQGADRILYVIDGGQSQHMEMVFAVARMVGWLPDHVEATHVGFGLVLGEDGKRLRTRSGENVRLQELLEEAVDRARAFLEARADERREPLPDDAEEIARVVGIGAVVYADLSQNRQSNYTFSFDRMLSLKGNTAPYLQYAYARIRSILREAGWAEATPPDLQVVLTEPQEVDLARVLVTLPDVLDRVVTEHAPNHLAAHLFELSQAFNQLYEHCPVLKAEEPSRSTRLALCAATAKSLRLGLRLLGIEVVDRI